MNIVYRNIPKKEELKHIKNIKVNGYSIIKNFIPKKIISQYLRLTKKTYKDQKTNSNTPKVWNTAKIIYNLQSKNIHFLRIFNAIFFEKILIKKINDPHFRNLEKNKPNYILNNLIARSSGNGKLFLHIDSGIPTGNVTTFMQIMIPLETTNLQTGCTVVVPKSHKSKKFTNRKTKKFKLVQGDPGDIFIWDGNLWHGSLPNQTNDTRWSLIATFSNWQFKQVFDIPRSIKQKIYTKLTVKEKILLGYLGIPSNSEYKRVTRSISVNQLEKHVRNY